MTGVLIRDVIEERDLERRRDTFVSVASHELRTLVTTILGFTELLLDDVHEGDQRRWLEHVHEDSLRLTSILDDMLDVSRIQSGRVKMTIERVDVPDVINDVIVGVTDQGLGIPSEEIDRVFDTFYRLKNEQTYEIRGTGLGLYIVKSLIEGIGGTLNVESEARVGSTFSFSMPESL
jgi:signal transduction histidine kinase